MSCTACSKLTLNLKEIRVNKIRLDLFLIPYIWVYEYAFFAKLAFWEVRTVFFGVYVWTLLISQFAVGKVSALNFFDLLTIITTCLPASDIILVRIQINYGLAICIQLDLLLPRIPLRHLLEPLSKMIFSLMLLLVTISPN